MSMNINDLKVLALHAAKGTIPATFAANGETANDYDVNAAFRDGLKELASTYSQFMKNRYDIYDERTPGLKNFALNGVNDFYPRLGYLAVGDKFTTNCVCYDSAVDTAWATESAFISALGACASNTLYGGIGSKGAILVSATAPSYGPKLRVIEKTTEEVERQRDDSVIYAQKEEIPPEELVDDGEGYAEEAAEDDDEEDAIYDSEDNSEAEYDESDVEDEAEFDVDDDTITDLGEDL